MKFLHVIFLAFLLLGAGGATAQDIFFNERAFLPDDLRDMPRQALSLKDYADQYYADCLFLEHPILNKETLPLFCACISANIYEILKPEDVTDIFLRTDLGDKQRRRITRLAYTPCMTQPLHEMIYGNCIEDKNLEAGLQKQHGKVCECVTDKAAQYWVSKGNEISKVYSSAIEESTDPVIRFLNSPIYARFLKDTMAMCLPADPASP